MSGILFYIAAIACVATLAVLMAGVIGFGSGKASPQFSNKMMRWRIVAQFLAVVFLLLMVAAAQSGS